MSLLKHTFLLSALMCLIQPRSNGDEAGVGLVLRAVSNSGWSYHCEDMVRAVNYFRHLGKDQSLNVLRSSLRAPESKPIQVILLCRLLFVNTNDWQLPRLGKPVPTLGTEVTNLNGRIQETFPLFPFALSKNVPFLVIEGYSTGGVLELPGDVIKECGSLPIISSDLLESETFSPHQTRSSGQLIVGLSHLDG